VLGIYITNDLKVAKQCKEAAKKAMNVLRTVKRHFPRIDEPTFLILYKAYVRPHLEYCVQAWSPYFKKDIECLEQVQRRATKLIKGFKNLSYENRLKRLKLTTLEKRRLRGDLIETFKIIGITTTMARKKSTNMSSSKSVITRTIFEDISTKFLSRENG